MEASLSLSRSQDTEAVNHTRAAACRAERNHTLRGHGPNLTWRFIYYLPTFTTLRIWILLT